ncbi:MAG: glycoside hydrolase/phage tail family protein, partial [Myxococcota bacterium]
IGSELRGLTQIRGANDSFPFVDALIQLAGEVRAILGPETQISYAADWSEYHGYTPEGTGDKYFHLDPLWADPNIDFIGIDNYMPLSDWRDGTAHADADAGSIYNLDYLATNVTAGEGYDWYYTSATARDAQRRTPITDGLANEPWVYRYKDLPNWWTNRHYNRVDGVRDTAPTAWEPQSKPFVFTELGCAAIDKGTNQPNKFLDPKSSESQLPHYSNGRRDDFMQMQYLRAMYQHYADPLNNPISTIYDKEMVDMRRAHVWAWDARPFPHFPGNQELWSDGDNYTRGHWLNGRSSSRTLASVVAEVCERSGVSDYDVSELYGLVRGYHVADASSARAALQPLMTTYGFEAAERDGTLVFTNRTGQPVTALGVDDLAEDPDRPTAISLTRAPATEVANRVQFEYLEAEADFEGAVSEIADPQSKVLGISRSGVPLSLTAAEGQAAVNRWLAETRVGQDSLSFALPPS